MVIRVKIFPLVLLSFVVVLLLWVPYYFYSLGPAFTSPQTLGAIEPTSFIIARGDGLREISERLGGQSLIKSDKFFRMYAILSGKAHRLKPGLYFVSGASSTPDIVNQFVYGPESEVTVRILEGATVQEIDTQLSALGVIKAGELLALRITSSTIADYPFLQKANGLEGFLFPDTYRFYYDSNPELVLKALLDNFARRAAQIIIDSRKNMNEVLIIASMIEKEVPDSDERRVVAGIMYKRLSIDMPLQIDATLPYADIHGEEYNTYKRYGLPPGPIGNPGLDAIKAALTPKTSNYLYYLSDPKTDKTIFGKTFEEHKANKEKYLY